MWVEGEYAYPPPPTFPSPPVKRQEHRELHGTFPAPRAPRKAFNLRSERFPIRCQREAFDDVSLARPMRADGFFYVHIWAGYHIKEIFMY